MNLGEIVENVGRGLRIVAVAASVAAYALPTVGCGEVGTFDKGETEIESTSTYGIFVPKEGGYVHLGAVKKGASAGRIDAYCSCEEKRRGEGWNLCDVKVMDASLPFFEVSGEQILADAEKEGVIAKLEHVYQDPCKKGLVFSIEGNGYSASNVSCQCVNKDGVRTFYDCSLPNPCDPSIKWMPLTGGK